MKSKFILLFYFAFLCYKTHSQSLNDGCVTKEISEGKFIQLPYVNNNQLLYSILDSVGYYQQNFSYSNALFRIPVKFWMYRTDNNADASEIEAKQLIYNLNEYNISNNTGFIYYLREIKIIKSKHRSRLGYYIEAPWISLWHKTDNCVNIHVVDVYLRGKMFGATTTVRGAYNKVTKAVYVSRQGVKTSVVHEVGHFFGLFHPHRNWNKGKSKQESVSRTRKNGKVLNCETNGDGLCDTPAEPLLSGTINSKCEYTGNQKDKWGDAYQPNTHNIMSYQNELKCREVFSPAQIGVMVMTARDMKICGWDANCYKSGTSYKYQYNFDQYEPDNSKATASLLVFGTSQNHTFHKVYVGKNKDFDTDIDWFKFEIKQAKSGKIEISTSKGNFQTADTQIFLYDENNNQMATDDNGNANQFSKIISTDLKKGFYYLKVIKKNSVSNPDIADYQIVVKESK